MKEQAQLLVTLISSAVWMLKASTFMSREAVLQSFSMPLPSRAPVKLGTQTFSGKEGCVCVLSRSHGMGFV
jgi:hypothetical protein